MVVEKVAVKPSNQDTSSTCWQYRKGREEQIESVEGVSRTIGLIANQAALGDDGREWSDGGAVGGRHPK
jgi:hypothetical protein